MNRLDRYFIPLFQAPDPPNGGSAGGDPPPTGGAPKPGDPPSGEGAPPSLAGTPAKAEEWKEYTPDPTKTPVENEALKAAHDKTKPAAEAAPAALDLAKLTLPEGFDAKDPLLAQFGTILSDEKLAPQDRAQQLINMHHSAVKKASEASSEYWKGVREGWVKEVKADPAIGGNNLEPTIGKISKMIDGLGDSEAKAFRQALDMSGLGDNPSVIRALNKWASVLTEGNHLTGTPPGAAQRSVAESFFPNSPGMSKTS